MARDRAQLREICQRGRDLRRRARVPGKARALSAELALNRLAAARHLHAANNFAGSERLAREALAADPELGAAHAVLSLALFGQGRARPALEAVQRALALDPTAEAFRAQALALHALKRRKEAVQAAQRATELAPASPSSANILGLVLEQAGKRRAAQEAFERAMRLAPGDDGFRGQYGLFLLRQKQLAAAELVAAELTPGSDHVAALLLRGGVAVRRNRPKEARDFALWVLSRDAVNQSAIILLTQAKAAESWWLGAWWRYAVFMATRPWWVRVLVLTPIVLVLCVAAGWFGIFAFYYFLAARNVFARMLRKELAAARGSVRLKRGF